jgi:two-component system nitrogen regulation sensor histidine kinase GlnL
MVSGKNFSLMYAPDLKDLHRSILDNLSSAVFLVDEQLLLKYLNPAGEEILGTGIRHAINRPITDFLNDQESQLIEHIKASIKSGHPITQREVCMKRVNGGEVTIDCSITPMLLMEAQQSLCLLEIIQVDRMVRISREEHLLSETHATQHMLRGLAHEIKNPLGGLRGAAQLLAGELNEGSLREYTDIIISEADRLRKLVDRMFGPNITPVKKTINIHKILEHIRHLAIAENPVSVVFETDYDPSIPEFKADRDLLVQAILNIVRNAVRAACEHNDEGQGRVTLKSRVLRKYTIGDVMHRLVVIVSVIDNGPGVKEELRPEIFFPMVSDSGGGAGLGLSISQNLISLHGGLIEFDSVVGHTEFRILLPLNGNNCFSLNK